VTGRELVASTLVLVEVPRALARRADESLWADTWTSVLGGLRLLEVDRGLLQQAARLQPPELRAADAVHLAAALAVGSALTAFLCYDRRLAQAAREHGLPVEAPA
jgi:predicted nucleic acid-binding protein